MKLLKILGLFTLVGIVAGCSIFRGDVDNAVPPTPLAQITSEYTLTTHWSSNVGTIAQPFNALVPAFIDEALYTSDSKGKVTKLRADNGQVLWQVDLEVPVSAGVGISNELVVVATAQGAIIALATDTGAIVWQSEVSSESLAPAAIAQGTVVVHVGDSKVYAFDEESGELLWVHEARVPSLLLRGGSSPVISDGQVFMGFASGRVGAFALNDGRPLWEYVLAVPSGRSEIERLVDIVAPVLKQDNVLYAVAYQGRIAALNSDNGQVIWQREMSSYRGLAIDQRAIYVVDDESAVWALDKRTGDTLWKQDALLHRALSNPSMTEQGIVVGDLEGLCAFVVACHWTYYWAYSHW